jgi:hypothetical protein
MPRTKSALELGAGSRHGPALLGDEQLFAAP